MSEPNPTISTVKLIDPPALVAADRLGAHLEARSAPLLRSIAGGAMRFAERVFRGWLGKGGERPALTSAAARSGVQSLPFPRPWFDDVRAWPARGITLRRAPQAPSVEPTRGTPAPAPREDQRAIELIASYVTAEEPVAPGEAEPAREVAPRTVAPPVRETAPVSLAARVLGRLDVVDRIVRAASAIFTAPDAAAPEPASSSPAVRQVPGLTPVYVDPPRAPVVEQGAPRAAAPAARQVSPAAPLQIVPPVSAVPVSPASAPHATTPGAPAAASAPVVTTATTFAAAVERERAAARLEPALPMVTPAIWPRVQQFLEKIAGPVSLARAGVAMPLRLSSLPAQPGARAVPAARAALAPSPTWVMPEVVAAPAGRTAMTPAARAAANEPARMAARAAVPAPATLVGEALLRSPQSAVAEGERFAPGRAAQQAELIAQIAEHRSLRQLGFPEPVPTPSPRWSADAFTMVVPAWSAHEVAAARAAAPSRSSPVIAGASRWQSGAPAPAVVVAQPGVVQPGAAIPAPLSLPVPGSIASLVAFVEAQIGPRLDAASRPLPVRAPQVVYVDSALAEVERRAPASERVAFSATRGVGPQVAGPAALVAPSIGLRSEQLAAEIGVRAAALTSEFLVEQHGEPTPALAAGAASRPWLSTAEWTLLSVFPSRGTAEEVAHAAAVRANAPSTRGAWPALPAGVPGLPSFALPVVEARPQEARRAADAAAPEARRSVAAPAGPFASPVSIGAPRPRMTTLVPFGDDASEPSELEAEPTIEGRGTEVPSVRAQHAPALPMLAASPASPRASAANDGRGPILHRLPDGRRPRGNRMVARAPAPVLASALSPSASVLAATEAAERRAEIPGSAPMWEQLRPLVTDAGGSRGASSEPNRPSPRASAVLELVTPFVDAARTESSSGGAAMAAAANAMQSVVGSGSRPSASTPPPVADRLSLADLTLISIVAADQQVAAADSEIAPDSTQKPTSAGASANPSHSAQDHQTEDDVEDIAEEAFQRLVRAHKNRRDINGESF